jgi:hypothetical protein
MIYIGKGISVAGIWGGLGYIVTHIDGASTPFVAFIGLVVAAGASCVIWKAA